MWPCRNPHYRYYFWNWEEGLICPAGGYWLCYLYPSSHWWPASYSRTHRWGKRYPPSSSKSATPFYFCQPVLLCPVYRFSYGSDLQLDPGPLWFPLARGSCWVFQLDKPSPNGGMEQLAIGDRLIDEFNSGLRDLAQRYQYIGGTRLYFPKVGRFQRDAPNTPRHH